MNKQLALLIFSLFIGSCGESSAPTTKRKLPPSDPVLEKNKADPNLGLGLEIKNLSRDFVDSLDDDALRKTMAVLSLEASLSLDGAALAEEYPDYDDTVILEFEALILLRSKNADMVYDANTMPAADKQKLSDLCRDSFVSVDKNFSSSANASKQSSLALSGFNLAWRSHHPQSLLEDIALLLYDFEIEARCGLQITPKWEGSEISKPYMFSFNFSPSIENGADPKSLYRGTNSASDFTEAIDSSIMLLELKDSDWNYGDDRWQILTPSAATMSHTSLERSIAALNPGTVGLDSPSSDGATCYYYENSLLPTTPSDEQSVSINLANSESIAFKIDSINPATAESRCANFEVAVSEKRVSLNYSCQDYRTVVTSTSCDLIATISNSLDPRNSVSFYIEPPAGDFHIIEAGGPEESIALLPKQENNPIRGTTPSINLIPGPISSRNFDEAQKEVVAKAFDLWIATHEQSYEDYVQGQITKIQYNTSTDTAICNNAGGWAYVGGGPSPDTFYWCEIGGGISQAFISNHSLSAHATIYRAALVLHESLHVSGQYHDADDAIPSPETRFSCTTDIGTAYSGIIAYSIFQCAQADDPLRPFCEGLADQAKSELKNELEYSLKESEGALTETNIDQCEDWALEMGVTLAL